MTNNNFTIVENGPEYWCTTEIGLINSYTSKSINPLQFPNETFELYSVPAFTSCIPEYIEGVKIGSSKQLVEPGDVLLCKINPRINRVWKVSKKSNYRQIASSEWIVVRQGLISSEFLIHYFRHNRFRELLCSDVSGVGGSLTRAQPVKVSRYPIYILPRAEQKEIASRLDNLLAQVDKIKTRLDAIPVILKQFRQSVLAAAVSGELTEEWRNEINEPTLQTFLLGEVTTKLTYGTSAKSEKTGKIPVLRMGNIQNGKLDWNDLVYTSDIKEIEKYKLKKGDVLFNRTNSPELVGKTAIYRGERDAIFAGYLIKIECSDTLNPEFLNICLNSPVAKEYCWRVKSDGVSQSNINAQKLADYTINLPSIREQDKIISIVTKLFDIEDTIEKHLLNAQSFVNDLTQSILSKAFSGELTAEWREQNPELVTGENGAEALLEKITAERNSTVKTVVKKTKRAKKAGYIMQKKEIIPILEVLKSAERPLDSQELLSLAGYPNDASTEDLEQFFLDIREQVQAGTIKRKRQGSKEIFTLTK
ncbi:MAG: hypothetical protein GX639_01340 [Fibrobacter sp.]|nr:hypothetical protein [Fibrobacter sp.]